MNQLYMVVGPLMYTKALQGSFTLGDSDYFVKVNDSGSLKIVDIYYENDLTLIEFVSLEKLLNDTLLGEPLKVNCVNHDYGKWKF